MSAPGSTLEPVVALVLTAEPWVQRFHRHCADHGGAEVRHVVVDPEAASAVAAGTDVLVASARWSALTPALRADLARARCRVVAVAGDPGAAELVAEVRRAAVGDAPGSTAVGGWATDPAAVVADAPRARTWVVGGPAGAGVTEIALGLGAAAVRAGTRAVVVDAAIAAPGVAPRCGLPLEPNLVTALDAVTFAADNVVHTCFDLGDGWPVLLGGPVPDATARWSGTAAVLDALAERFDPAICDVGPAADPVVAGATVARAGVVVAVGAGTPTGTVRLVDWIRAHPGPPPVVVVDRAPAARARRAQITAEITDAVGVTGVWFVPRDPRVDRAVWTAGLPTRGPFTRAVDEVWRAARAVAGS